MAIVEIGRHFKLVSNEHELRQILDILERFLPQSVKFHQTLRTYLNDRIWDFYFYICNDWPETVIVLHFPGITSTPKDNLFESLGIFCPGSQLHKLDMLFNEDILIDWKRPLFLNFTHKDIIDKMEFFYHTHQLGVASDKVQGDLFLLSEPDTSIIPLDKMKLNDEMTLLQLLPEHARKIHDLYPANEIESIDLFEKLIEKLSAFGIFTPNGDLIAWMVQSYYGAMFSMQTKPQYRRKGYGTYLARHLTKAIQNRGYIPFVMIRPDNIASKSLHEKLAYRKFYEMARILFRPNSNSY